MSLCVGDRVRLTKAIFDHGEDHHPPGCLAIAGAVLVVRSVGNAGAQRIAVSHEDVTDNAFWISRDEYEPTSLSAEEGVTEHANQD